MSAPLQYEYDQQHNTGQGKFVIVHQCILGNINSAEL